MNSVFSWQNLAQCEIRGQIHFLHVDIHLCQASPAQIIKNLLSNRRSRFNPSVRKIPWRKEWLSSPVFLSREFHGQKNPVDCSPWVAESGMTEWLTLSLFSLCPRNICLKLFFYMEEYLCLQGWSWSRTLQPVPVFFPRKFHWQRNLASYSPWDRVKDNRAHTNSQEWNTI